MKALVLVKFGSLAVETVPDPAPQTNEILIRIAVTGICGSDIHGYTGDSGRRVPGQVMGHESAGHIAALGGGLENSGFHLGQPVTFNPVIIPVDDLQEFAGREQHDPRKKVIGVAPEIVSGFAELISVPSRNVIALADDTPIEHGALIEPLAVALHAVRRAGVRPNQSVLVVGGGPIGQSVVLTLRMQGVENIVVSEVAPARRDLLEKLGVRAIDPSKGSFASEVASVLGGLADVAVDAVGVSATIADALAATAAGSTIVLVGMGSPTLSLDAFAVSTGERAILGSFTYTAEDFADAAHWVASENASVDALISRIVSLDDAPGAFAALAGGDGTPGKVLVRVAAVT